MTGKPDEYDEITFDAPLSATVKAVFQDTAQLLKGSERRMFMAKTARLFGAYGHRRAEREFGWDRKTLRKGEYELQHGPIQDQFSTRGRKSAETHLPHLDRDIQRIVQPESQTDPTFQSTRRYRRITAPSVRKQLIAYYGYADDELPSVRTILTKLNDLDYRPRKVVKSKPKKKRFPKRTPSFTNSTSSIHLLTPRRAISACHWTRRPRFGLARIPVGVTIAAVWRPAITTLPLRRRSSSLASCCRPLTICGSFSPKAS